MESRKELLDYFRLVAHQFELFFELFSDDGLKDNRIDSVSALLLKDLVTRDTSQHGQAGIDLALFAENLFEQKKISEMTGARFVSAISGLLVILLRAERGDGLAQEQLLAIDKVLHPHDYDIKKLVSAISDLSTGYEYPVSMIHGRLVECLMADLLRRAVEPVEAKDTASLREAWPMPCNFKIRPIANADESLARFWRDGDTLEDLAIRIYADEANLAPEEVKKALESVEKLRRDHFDMPRPSFFSPEILIRWNENRKSKNDDFFRRLDAAITRRLEGGDSNHKITQTVIAEDLNIGFPGAKSSSDALSKQMRRHGNTEHWKDYVAKVASRGAASETTEGEGSKERS